MGAEMVLIIFGSLTSFLLGVLSVIGRNIMLELREVGKTVNHHGRELSKIGETLKHMDRRQSTLEANKDFA